jgi:hypothetical protein
MTAEIDHVPGDWDTSTMQAHAVVQLWRTHGLERVYIDGVRTHVRVFRTETLGSAAKSSARLKEYARQLASSMRKAEVCRAIKVEYYAKKRGRRKNVL